MSENLKMIIAVVAGIIVFVICCIKLFKGKTSKEKFIINAKEKGNYTTATLVDNKLRLGNDESGNASFKYDRMKCTYEYQVNGISYKKRITFQSPGMVSVKFPYTITVYYNPNRPSKCICKEEVQNKGFGCFATIVLAGLTIKIVYELLKLIG